MSNFSDRELKRYTVSGVAVAFAGLLMLLLGKTIHAEDTFWTPYTAAVIGIAWLIIMSGVLWFSMSMAHLCTSYFSVNETLSVDKAMLFVAVIVFIMSVAGFYFIPRLPNTPREKLPNDPKARVNLLERESRDRLYVVVLILAAGASFAAFPCIRCFGPRLFAASEKGSGK